MIRPKDIFRYILPLVFMFSGCSLISHPRDPSGSWNPPEWAEKRLARDRTWASVREREVESAEKMQLADLLDVALTNNPVTREVWEKARAAQTRIKQAESEWYPQVSVSSMVEHNKKSTNNSAGDLNQTDYTVLGEARLLLMDFGGRASRVSSTKQTLIQANFAFNQALQDVFLDTAKAYYGLYAAEALVDSAMADVADSEASLAAARHRLRAGLVSKLDVLQAESTYQNSLYSLEDAKGKMMAARAKLSLVMGVPADASFEIAEPATDISEDITKENVSELIEKAIMEKPSMAAAKAGLAAKEAELAAANSDLWPTFSTGGKMSAGEHKFFGAQKERSETSYKRDQGYSAFLSVEWDVFDGFYRYSKRNEARAMAEAERASLTQAELEASADVWTKYFDFKTAERKYAFSKAFLSTSRTSYELASDSYRAGLKSILDLLQAQSQLSDARSKMIGSREDVFVSMAELAHSIGALTVPGKDNKEGER
jgi:outer membrane protein